MKMLFIPVFCLTFLFTGTISWHSVQVDLAENHLTAPTITPTPLPTVCAGFGCQGDVGLATDLLKDEYVTKIAGAKLPLDVPNGWSSESYPEFIKDAKVEPLEHGGFLVAYANRLCRFDDNHKLLWSYTVDQIMIDFATIESMNLVYGTAFDNVMFILDIESGKKLYSNGRNGLAAYGAVIPYLRDGVLIQDNFSGYRNGSRSPGYASLNDGLTLWHGTKEIWHIDFPPDAEVVVRGRRIFAVTKSTSGIYVTEIFPPRTTSK